MSLLGKFSSFLLLLLLSCFPDQHLQVLLAKIQLTNTWSCHSIRSCFPCRGVGHCPVLAEYPGCAACLQEAPSKPVLIKAYDMTTFQICMLLSPFPLREAPEIILWFYFFFIFRESSCLLFHCQSPMSMTSACTSGPSFSHCLVCSW